MYLCVGVSAEPLVGSWDVMGGKQRERNEMKNEMRMKHREKDFSCFSTKVKGVKDVRGMKVWYGGRRKE